jgi:hypothetical protein
MGENGTRSVDEIQREIEVKREDLVFHVRQLETAVRQRLDWRHQVRRRPLAFAGVAFVLGFWLAVR